MKETYYALLIAILTPCTPEQAFGLMESGEKKHVDSWIRTEMLKEMIRLKKQGLTYQQIGDIYGLGKDDVFKRIKRANKQCAV